MDGQIRHRIASRFEEQFFHNRRVRAGCRSYIDHFHFVMFWIRSQLFFAERWIAGHLACRPIRQRICSLGSILGVNLLRHVGDCLMLVEPLGDWCQSWRFLSRSPSKWRSENSRWLWRNCVQLPNLYKAFYRKYLAVGRVCCMLTAYFALQERRAGWYQRVIGKKVNWAFRSNI